MPTRTPAPARTTRMSSTDRARWYAARDRHDLGRLTAQWLEGAIASQPGYQPGWGPDPETTELVPVLARANRAGYRTDASQPGRADTTGYDGALWDQRAAVEGWIDRDRVSGLVTTAESAGLRAAARSASSSPYATRPRSARYSPPSR